MKYKYYTTQMVCRDNIKRTITITTDATDNDQTKALTVTGLQIDLDTTTDVFEPIRFKTGNLSIYCDEDTSPEDFLPSSFRSHQVSIYHEVHDDPEDPTVVTKIYEFSGYITGNTRSQSYPAIGEEFTLEIRSKLAILEAMNMTYTNVFDRFTVLDILKKIFYDKLGIHLIILPELWANSWTEKLCISSIMNSDSDIYINESNVLVKDKPTTISCADILRAIANFYGVTFIEQNNRVVAITPDQSSYKLYNLLSLSGTNYPIPKENVSDIIGLGTSDIEASPSLISISYSAENASTPIDFNGDNISQLSSTLGSPDFYIDIYKPGGSERLGTIGCIKLQNKSFDGLLTTYSSGTSAVSQLSTHGTFIIGSSEIENLDLSGDLAIAMKSTTPTSYDVAKFVSKGPLSEISRTILVEFKAVGLVKNANGTYSFGKIQSYADGTPNGYVSLSCKSGNYNSGPVTIYCEQSGNSYFKETTNEVKCYAFLYKDNFFEDEVTIEVTANHITGNDGKVAEVILLYDFKTTTDAWQHPQWPTEIVRGNHSQYIDDLTKYSYKQKQDSIGDDYRKEIIFSPFQGAFNSLRNRYSTLHHPSFLLNRLKNQLSHNIVTIKLPTPILMGEKFLFEHKGENYLLTGYSRDYMTGIDTISITKIS